MLSVTQPQIIKLSKKRELIKNYLNSSGLAFLDGDTTFYFFINLKNYNCNPLELSKHLLFQHKISVVPGEAYGKSTKNFIRLSIGTESVERICKAIDKIKMCLQTCANNKNISII